MEAGTNWVEVALDGQDLLDIMGRESKEDPLSMSGHRGGAKER